MVPEPAVGGVFLHRGAGECLHTLYHLPPSYDARAAQESLKGCYPEGASETETTEWFYYQEKREDIRARIKKLWDTTWITRSTKVRGTHRGSDEVRK